MRLIDVKRVFETNPAVKIVHSEEAKFAYDVQGYRREVWLDQDRHGLDRIVLATPAGVIYLSSLDDLRIFINWLGKFDN